MIEESRPIAWGKRRAVAVMNEIRIAMVTQNWLSTIGGITEYVRNLQIRIGADPRFDVFIVAPDENANDRNGYVVKGDGVALVIGTLRALYKFQPQIVHCHDSMWMGAGCLIYRISHPRSCRFLFSLHTLRLSNSGSVYAKVSFAALKKYFKNQVRRLIIGPADYITAVSKAMALEFKDLKIEVVPFGVEQIHPSTSDIEKVRNLYGLTREKPVIASIGVFFHKWKVDGLEILLEAFAILLTRFPQAKLLIVGDGQWSEYLHICAKRLEVEQNVIFTGFLEDSSSILGCCDVYAHLAKKEALGFAIAEAMYQGKPVVGVKLGGIPELVTDGETGILVAPTPAAAAMAIEKLLSDADLSARLGRNGKNKIEKRYTWPIVGAKFQSVYVKLFEQIQL